MFDLNNLNKDSSFQYRTNLTSKYVQIKCQNCKTFSYWYKNRDDVDMIDFCNVDKNKVTDLKDEN